MHWTSLRNIVEIGGFLPLYRNAVNRSHVPWFHAISHPKSFWGVNGFICRNQLYRLLHSLFASRCMTISFSTDGPQCARSRRPEDTFSRKVTSDPKKMRICRSGEVWGAAESLRDVVCRARPVPYRLACEMFNGPSYWAILLSPLPQPYSTYACLI